MLFYILAQSTSHDSDIVKYLNKRGVLNLYKEIAPLQRLLTVAEEVNQIARHKTLINV